MSSPGVETPASPERGNRPDPCKLLSGKARKVRSGPQEQNPASARRGLSPHPIIPRQLIIRIPPLHPLQIPLEPPRHPNHMPQLRKRQRPAAELRELPRRRDGVADLPPVHVLVGQRVDVVVQVVVVDARLAEVAQPREEVAPDLAPLGFLEVVVVQGELDAGFEGLVEGADSVGGED